jgi:glycosyltransferase involved in cell wall biosynthesis
VGSLSARKGADILGKVAKIIMEMNLSVRFLVVGPGDPKQFALDRLPNTICTGGLPHHEVLSIYAHSDIFVLPSRHEGRPNALLEAMASGLPSVATRLPGVVELLTDESGIIVDTENPLALLEAIRALVEDCHKRKAMGKNAKLRIAELSLNWDISANKYLSLFKRVSSCAA